MRYWFESRYGPLDNEAKMILGIGGAVIACLVGLLWYLLLTRQYDNAKILIVTFAAGLVLGRLRS